MIRETLPAMSTGSTSVGERIRGIRWPGGEGCTSLFLPDELDHSVDLKNYFAESWIQSDGEQLIGTLACHIGNTLFVGLVDPCDAAVCRALGGDRFPTELDIVFGMGKRRVRAFVGPHILASVFDRYNKWRCSDRNAWLACATAHAHRVHANWTRSHGGLEVKSINISEILVGADGRHILRRLSVAAPSAA